MNTATLPTPAHLVNWKTLDAGFFLDDRATESLLQEFGSPAVNMAWHYIKTRIRFKEQPMIFDGTYRVLEPGQCAITSAWLAKVMGKRNKSSASRIIQRLAALINVSLEVSSHGRSGGVILTFHDWEAWQNPAKSDEKNRVYARGYDRPQGRPSNQHSEGVNAEQKATNDSIPQVEADMVDPQVDPNVDRKETKEETMSKQCNFYLKGLDALLKDYEKKIGYVVDSKKRQFLSKAKEEQLDLATLQARLDTLCASPFLKVSTVSPMRLFHDPSTFISDTAESYNYIVADLLKYKSNLEAYKSLLDVFKKAPMIELAKAAKEKQETYIILRERRFWDFVIASEAERCKRWPKSKIS